MSPNKRLALYALLASAASGLYFVTKDAEYAATAGFFWGVFFEIAL